MSVAGTLAILRGLAELTSVSVFAQNVTTLLGFGLAIDYSLFLVTRYREELARGRPVTEAIAATLRTAGRTVLFSALTVMVSLAAMTVFPIFYLQSLAYAGIAVVGLAAASSLLILPPVLAVIGHRIDRFDVFAPLRRRLPGNRTGRGVRYRLAVAVTRRPAWSAVIVTALLVVLALPFTRPGTAGAWVSLVTGTDPNSPAGQRYVQGVRAVSAPGPALVGGDAATLTDEQAMLRSGIGWAASFGAMAYVFQDGHLKWLVGDFVSSGRLEVTTPLLMFCVAFGLSMDYTVFLLSRIREHHAASGDPAGAVVAGLDRTGRLITTAALIVAPVLGALTTSHISLLKMLGFGLALAVLVDATLVRGLLVPAVMKLTGRAAWWAPRPLTRLHARAGLRDA